MNFLLLRLIMRQCALAGEGFDPSYASCDAALGNDLERADLRRILQMRTAAKLDAVAAHIHHADNIAVFLAKERHRTLFSCGINAHFLRHDGIACEDRFIDQLFDLFDFLSRHRRKMRKVEAQSVRADIRAGLLYMRPQHRPQSLLQQMRCGVVSCGCHSVFFVDCRASLIVHGNRAFRHRAQMRDLAADHLNAVCHLDQTIDCLDRTMIADLTAAFCIEGRSVEEDSDRIAGLCACGNSVIRNQRNDFCILHGIHIIAREGCFQIGRQFIINRDSCAHVALCASCRTRTLLLRLHLCRESVLIDAHTCFLQNFLGQIHRKAIGIVKAERLCAAHHALSLCAHLLHVVLEDFHALVDGLIEAVFLDGEDFEDIFLLVHQLGVCLAAASDYRLAKLCQELALDAQQLAMTSRAAQQSAQNIAATFIGGQNAVRRHECHGTNMVCDDTHGNIDLMLLAVLHASLLTNRVANEFHGIHIENGVHALHDGCHSFQTHAGIYVFGCKLGIGAVLMRIKLRQNQIPEFHVSVTIAADLAIGAAAAIFGSAVVINFRAGTAGTCAVLPEIVIAPQFCDAIPRQTNPVMPDLTGLVILLEDGNMQLILGDFQPFCHKFPRPGDDFVFEIIAKGEIAQHFEECAVARGFAYVFNIARTDAFLAGRHALAGRDFLPGEIRLHGRHAGIDEQQAVVIFRHQREGFQPQMILRFKKFQKKLSDLVYAKTFHIITSLTKKAPNLRKIRDA